MNCSVDTSTAEDARSHTFAHYVKDYNYYRNSKSSFWISDDGSLSGLRHLSGKFTRDPPIQQATIVPIKRPFKNMKFQKIVGKNWNSKNVSYEVYLALIRDIYGAKYKYGGTGTALH